MFDKPVEVADLAELCTAQNERDGVWVQVQVFGKKWNVEVCILGNESDVVQAYSRDKMRELRKYITFSQGEVDASDEAFDDAMSDGVADALVRFVGIRKFTDKSPLAFDGKELGTVKTDDNADLYEALLRGSPDIRKFITAEAQKRNNFLSSGKKN